MTTGCLIQLAITIIDSPDISACFFFLNTLEVSGHEIICPLVTSFDMWFLNLYIGFVERLWKT